ncbi:MAG: pyridoxamine 5'-phosphate oxidase family protein [Clostridiales Family XIII bacterium]|nr:pyridoxamine 5'-phosphate oxidase family protein [Clostridiales Family XIII bacterium]
MRKANREVRAIKEIQDVIDRCDACRIGLAGDGAPYIVPMNFGFELSGGGTFGIDGHDTVDADGGVFGIDSGNTAGIDDGNISACTGASPEARNLTLWFHCATVGRKLDLIGDGCEAGFEMDTDHELRAGDNACDYSMCYASVIGVGRIGKVTDEAEKLHGLKMVMAHYGGEGLPFKDAVLAHTCVLRLDATAFTCKRLKK